MRIQILPSVIGLSLGLFLITLNNLYHLESNIFAWNSEKLKKQKIFIFHVSCNNYNLNFETWNIND